MIFLSPARAPRAEDSALAQPDVPAPSKHKRIMRREPKPIKTAVLPATAVGQKKKLMRREPKSVKVPVVPAARSQKKKLMRREPKPLKVPVVPAAPGQKKKLMRREPKPFAAGALVPSDAPSAVVGSEGSTANPVPLILLLATLAVVIVRYAKGAFSELLSL